MLRAHFSLPCLFAACLGAVFPGVPASAQVTDRVVDGWAVSDDVIRGRADEVARMHPNSTFISIPTRYWPKGIVPYTVDPTIPNPQRITDAVNYFNQNTIIRLIPRTTEANYIQMVRTPKGDGLCASQIGMIGGAQPIIIQDTGGCLAGAIVHEIGHALGMYHEQTRADRNKYVTVQYENIDKTQAFAWDFGNSQSDGPFHDYLSRMHYLVSNFSSNDEVTTQTVPPGMPLEPNFMSAGDLEWINKTYGTPNTQTTITSNPEGLALTVDGQSIVTPKSFAWAFGSTHTVAAAVQQDPSVAGIRYVPGRWSDNGDASHTITASAAMTVFVASFVRQISFSAGVTFAGSGTVTVDPPPPADGYVTSTMDIRLTATPAPGYTFQRWVGSSANLLCYMTAYGQNPGVVRTFNKLPQGCSALFTRSPVTTVATDPPGRPIVVDGSSFTAPQGFAWTPGSTHTIEAAAVSFATTAPVTRTFPSWDDGGAASHTVTAGSASATITAKYKTQWELAITQPATGTGTIMVSPAGNGYYDAGAIVQLTATPAPGYQFAGWSGDLAGNTATRPLVMDQQRAVTATFSKTLPAIALLNGATFQGTAVSPGEIVTLFGTGLGPPMVAGLQLDSMGKVANTLAGTQVTFDGVPAPLIFVSAFQTAAIVPYSVAGKTSTVLQVTYNNVKTPAITIPVTDAAPGFFTANSSGSGPAAFLNQDGSVNSAANPAARGSIVAFYVTGEGQTFPAGVDGLLASTVPLPAPVLPVSVRIGGFPALVQYAGAAPGLVAGVMQVNATVPMEVPPGSPSLYLVVGNVASPAGVTLFVK